MSRNKPWNGRWGCSVGCSVYTVVLLMAATENPAKHGKDAWDYPTGIMNELPINGSRRTTINSAKGCINVLTSVCYLEKPGIQIATFPYLSHLGWPDGRNLRHGRLPKDQHPILAAACVNQPFKAGQTIITQGHLVAKLPGVGVDVSLESFVLFVVVFWIAWCYVVFCLKCGVLVGQGRRYI